MVNIIDKLLLWLNGYRHEIDMGDDIIMNFWMPIHNNLLDRRNFPISHYIKTGLIKRITIFKKNRYEL